MARAWQTNLIILLLAMVSVSNAADFDHDATRFALDGFHRLVECESCHVQGRFQGTPSDCASCHGGSSVISAGGKNLQHIASSDQCEDCHRSDNWQSVARVDHSQTMGVCEQCHNGVQADGKPADHPVTTAACDTCHVSTSWSIVTFDHGTITQPCSTCHNGSTATGKGTDHLTTMAECDTCHSVHAWVPATFDHANVTGSCSTCHDGSRATGKNDGHFVTALECDTCHNTTNWSTTNYRHDAGGGYPGEHRTPLACEDCHIGNVQTNVWPFPAYQPDCAGCHANSYKMDAHTKVDTPRIFYTVSELRDCTGACHTYTDASLTTIRRMRTGEHRITGSDFDD